MDGWKGSQVSSCELIKGHHVCDCTSSLYVVGNSGELCKVISMKSGSFTFRRSRRDCENYYILMMAVGLFHSCTESGRRQGRSTRRESRILLYATTVYHHVAQQTEAYDISANGEEESSASSRKGFRVEWSGVL